MVDTHRHNRYAFDMQTSHKMSSKSSFKAWYNQLHKNCCYCLPTHLPTLWLCISMALWATRAFAFSCHYDSPSLQHNHQSHYGTNTYVFTVPEVTAEGAGCLLFEQQMWGHLAQGCIRAAHWKLLPNQCQSVINVLCEDLFICWCHQDSPLLLSPFYNGERRRPIQYFLIIFVNINCLCLTWILFTFSS